MTTTVAVKKDREVVTSVAQKEASEVITGYKTGFREMNEEERESKKKEGKNFTICQGDNGEVYFVEPIKAERKPVFEVGDKFEIIQDLGEEYMLCRMKDKRVIKASKEYFKKED